MKLAHKLVKLMPIIIKTSLFNIHIHIYNIKIDNNHNLFKNKKKQLQTKRDRISEQTLTE